MVATVRRLRDAFLPFCVGGESGRRETSPPAKNPVAAKNSGIATRDLISNPPEESIIVIGPKTLAGRG